MSTRSEREDLPRVTARARRGARWWRARGSIIVGVAAVLLLGATVVSVPTAAAEEPTAAAAKKKKKKSVPGTFEYGCRVQQPQSFLKRRTFVKKRIVQGAKHTRALRWLVEQYGHADTETTRAWNSEAAATQATTVKFMGLPVSVHTKVAPALTCVEKRIRATCKKRAYSTHAVGGFRNANSYRGMEVSNHLFGIAVDLDPERNPCCGCVEPWSSHPRCTEKVDSPYERADLPKCWISAFRRYGFDWLGHDDLEDTMHFEFLGDPDLIRR
jgi:hypothetical protein